MKGVSTDDRRIPLPLFPEWLRWAAVAAIAAVILYYSIPAEPDVAPAGPTPETEGSPNLITLAAWRHFLAYLLLGLSVAYAITDRATSRRKKVAFVVITVTGYGLAIELGQALTVDREASSTDVLVNGTAAVISCTWYALEPRLRPVAVTGERIRHLVRNQFRR